MLWLPLLWALLAAPAAAQYTYDPANADEVAKPGTLFFGAAKDDRGHPVADVTIFIEGEQSSFVLLTDRIGRFSRKLLLDAPPDRAVLRCAKQGWKVLRLSRRAGPAANGTSLQVDCVLRPISARGAK